VVSRIGTIIAPYLLLMGHYSPMVLGLGALSAGLFSLMLPETLGHSLPESLLDGEKFGIVLPHCWTKPDKEAEGGETDKLETC
jgi:hypothetical protein